MNFILTEAGSTSSTCPRVSMYIHNSNFPTPVFPFVRIDRSVKIDDHGRSETKYRSSLSSTSSIRWRMSHEDGEPETLFICKPSNDSNEDRLLRKMPLSGESLPFFLCFRRHETASLCLARENLNHMVLQCYLYVARLSLQIHDGKL